MAREQAAGRPGRYLQDMLIISASQDHLGRQATGRNQSLRVHTAFCPQQVLETLFKDTEKKVPGFSRLQGDSFLRACRSYAFMKSGNVWSLREEHLPAARAIVAQISTPSSLAG